MGFLGTQAGVAADINLLLQLALLALLVFGRTRVKEKDYALHGRLMAVAVTLNAASIAVVMLPSLLLGLGFIAAYPTNPVSITTIAHAVLGAAAELLGIYLVYKWRFTKSVAECMKNKRLMIPTMALWTTTVALGVLMYLQFYVFLLAG